MELSKSLRTRLSIFATSSEIRLEEEERKFEIREYIRCGDAIKENIRRYDSTKCESKRVVVKAAFDLEEKQQLLATALTLI